ncbi:hypothetical protein CEQ90_09030 [Lewinellaceae bacterium SD302]|nr:hypothetical protein CEQ90_09030 [Lewinellaceae bacterium SD302]
MHHPDLLRSVNESPYAGLLIVYTLLAGGGAYWVFRQLKSVKHTTVSLGYRGIYAFLLSQLFAAITLIAFNAVSYMPPASVASRVFYFFGFSTLHALAILVLVAASYALGQPLLEPFRARLGAGFKIFGLGLGASLLGTIFVLLGLVGLLNIYVGWGLLAVIFAWRFHPVKDFLIDTLWVKQRLTFDKWWSPALWVLLFSILGLNWLGAFKTFPMGYDGSALYVNLATLLAQKGSLVAGGQAYNWSVFMGAGEVLFASSTMTILLSHLMNFACLFVLYRIGRFWLTPAYALLATVLTAIAPYYVFHVMVDEKVDLAFAFLLLSAFGILAALYRGVGEEPLPEKLSLLGDRWQPAPLAYATLLAGWLTGYGFGVKYTAIIFTISLVCWLFYQHGRLLAGAGAFFAALGLIFIGRIYRFGYLEMDGGSATGLGAVLFVIGLAALIYNYRRDFKLLLQPVLQTALLLGAFFLAFSPWAVKHLAEHGRVNVSNIIEGESAAPEIRSLQPLGFLEEPVTKPLRERYSDLPATEDELRRESQHAASPYGHLTQMDTRFLETRERKAGRNASQQAAYEEIKRYIGYEEDFYRYTSLPYDLSTNVNIPLSRHLELGFLFLLLLPLLFLVAPVGKRRWWIGLLASLGWLFYLSTVLYAMYANDGDFSAVAALTEFKNNYPTTSSAWFSGIYFGLLSVLLGFTELLSPLLSEMRYLTVLGTVLTMIGGFVAVFFLLRPRLSGVSTQFKAFLGFVAVYGFLWWLMGNGVLWYGMPLFVAFPIVLLYWFDQPARLLGEESAGFTRYFGGGVIGLSLVLGTLYFFTSPFPGGNDLPGLLRWPYVDYFSSPTATRAKVVDAFNPVVREAMRVINAEPETRVYRVNTHYGFFIENNDTRVYSDPVLELFDRTSWRMDDPSQFFTSLKEQGFGYVLLDLRTGTNDRTPDGNLMRKYGNFGGALMSAPEKVELVVTDNLIEDPGGSPYTLPNGQRVTASRGLAGKTVKLGNLALFRIR